MGLPPFTFQALIKAQARHSDLAENCLSQIADFFSIEANYGITNAWPNACTVQQKSGAISLAVIIAASIKNDVAKALREYQQAELEKNSQVRLILDADPQDLS